MIDLNMIMYLQADDHYTVAYYTSGTHFLMPFGLSKVESSIAEFCGGEHFLVRLGRKYIINKRCIFHINAIKQEIQLTDNQGERHTLHLPKLVLRKLIGSINAASEIEM